MYSVGRASLFTVGALLPTLGTILVALRFYCRRLRAQYYGMDDWLAIAAAMLTWCFGIIVIVGTAVRAYGGHTHIDPATGQDQTGPEETDASKLNLATTIVFMLAFCAIKLSALFLYKRIFITRLFQRILIGMIVTIICWTLAFLLSQIFQCGRHVDSGWKPFKQVLMYCDDYEAQELAYAISDVVFDFVVIALPIPCVWTLQTTTGQKIGLTFVFLSAFFSTAAACVRLHFISVDMFGTKMGFRDWIGYQSIITLWSLVEAGVGTCAICLPMLRPLFADRSINSTISSLYEKNTRPSMPHGARSYSLPSINSNVTGVTATNSTNHDDSENSIQKDVEMNVPQHT